MRIVNYSCYVNNGDQSDTDLEQQLGEGQHKMRVKLEQLYMLYFSLLIFTLSFVRHHLLHHLKFSWNYNELYIADHGVINHH